jgi:hypothetical protein
MGETSIESLTSIVALKGSARYIASGMAFQNVSFTCLFPIDFITIVVIVHRFFSLYVLVWVDRVTPRESLGFSFLHSI